MKKTSKKSKRPVVRGPQLGLKLKAKGEPPRTARMRFVEPPSKRKGNPFFALRVPRNLLRAFLALANKKKMHPNEMVKGFMSKATGVKLVEGDNNA